MNLYKRIENQLQSRTRVNIVIAGITCSGKTTLANAIWKHFSDKYKVAVMSQDDYFKDYYDMPVEGRTAVADATDAFWMEEFKFDVAQLLKDGVVMTPRYDIATNTRISKNRIIRSGRINIFEGLHTIHLLGDLKNSIFVYVDTDIETCLERRIARDTSKYHIPEPSVRWYWNNYVIPMSERYVFPQMVDADVIIDGKGGDAYDC
ncbi:MAG: AAA family ATPase [Clostridia bacterium]|nr:AAA family ATPase [Clostridia bacterium]